MIPVSLEVEAIPSRRVGECHIASPLAARNCMSSTDFAYQSDDDWVLNDCVLPIQTKQTHSVLAFERAGPRAKICFDPTQTTAAIVTCGGLCPGLNDVVRSLVLELSFNYGISKILGIRYGYAGMNPASQLAPWELSSRVVEDIHLFGGSVLGTSRGEQPVPIMVDFLVENKIDLLFCVGGDGTQRGAAAIAEEVHRRGLRMAVVGIPKTIDNDLAFNDQTFGVVTAVEEAHRVLIQAHTEARAVRRGIGLVKVMGRDAGFIACGAAMASQVANFVLIPEVPLQLTGPQGFLNVLRARLARRNHAVIVVAEGAGQSLFQSLPVQRDQSGNVLKYDIGVHLKQEILEYFRSLNEPVDLKYIDPSYLVRSVPADCDDRILCDKLARHAAHAAMAGKTNLIICYKNNKFMHVPIPLAVAKKQQVDVHGQLWSSVLATTGQPATWSA